MRFDNKVFLAAFIISSNSSLSLVENPNFNRLLQYANSSAKSVSRHTLGRDINTLYIGLLQQVQRRLQEHCDTGAKISLTLDAWSSTTHISFLAVTGHYIDSHTWQLKSILLVFERLRGSYSVEALG